MNIMGSISTKTHSPTTIGLPLSRDVRIVAHVWPTDKPGYKDIRFHIYATPAKMEVEILLKILNTYAETVSRRPDDSLIGCILQNPLVPLIQKKCEELCFNMRWVFFDR